MRNTLLAFAVLSISILASCDVQSEISKKSVEKYAATPAPSVSPTPTEEPIEPADVVNGDTTDPGPTISINRTDDKMNVVCNKYNRVMVNGGAKIVTVKGVCSQIMINGDHNEVTAEAVAEIIYNGNENKLSYSRYANGKRPIVTDNTGGNISEKVARSKKK